MSTHKTIVSVFCIIIFPILFANLAIANNYGAITNFHVEQLGANSIEVIFQIENTSPHNWTPPEGYGYKIFIYHKDNSATWSSELAFGEEAIPSGNVSNKIPVPVMNLKQLGIDDGDSVQVKLYVNDKIIPSVVNKIYLENLSERYGKTPGTVESRVPFDSTSSGQTRVVYVQPPHYKSGAGQMFGNFLIPGINTFFLDSYNEVSKYLPKNKVDGDSDKDLQTGFAVLGVIAGIGAIASIPSEEDQKKETAEELHKARVGAGNAYALAMGAFGLATLVSGGYRDSPGIGNSCMGVLHPCNGHGQ